jgi:outer membrane receptor protein involved in Fe transport
VDLTDNLAFRVGGSVERLFGEYDYWNRTRTLEASATGDLSFTVDTTEVEMDPSGNAYGAFGAVRLKPVPWSTVEVGLRYDRRTYTEDSDISPRVHALVDLGERTSLRAGWGQYHQSQGIYELEAGDGEETFTPSERTTQIALGVEHKPREDLTIRAEAYHRDLDRPRRFYWNRWREIQPFPEVDGDRYRIDPTDGRARGVELLAFKEGGRWSWSASYALSAAEDRIEEEWVRRYWDQPHALAFTLGWRPNHRWTVTGAWQARSGWPYTPQVIEFDTLTVFRDEGTQWPLRWKEDFGPMNSVRLPTYHRLDLRVTRRFDVGKGVLDLYVDVFNAYDQQNLRSFDYGVRSINGRVMLVRYPDEELLPILPSLGLRWEF